jgi:hypothetical protein
MNRNYAGNIRRKRKRNYLNYKTDSLKGRILERKAYRLMRNRNYRGAILFYIKALKSFINEFKGRLNYTNSYYYGNYDYGHSIYMNFKINQIKRNIRKAKRILNKYY